MHDWTGQKKYNLKFLNKNSEHAVLQIRRSVVLLFYVHGKHLRSCRDGQLT